MKRKKKKEKIESNTDDTVIFEYYILEKASDGIDVYYSPSSFDEAEFLYHAVREN